MQSAEFRMRQGFNFVNGELSNFKPSNFKSTLNIILSPLFIYLVCTFSTYTVTIIHTDSMEIFIMPG